MIRVLWCFFLSFVAASAAPTSTQEKDGLRLDVTYVTTERYFGPGVKAASLERFGLEITSIITNVSDRSITIPTSTYSGEPTCTGGDAVSRFYACFNIGFRYIENRRMQSSPYRYFPMTLKPGDSIELPQVEFHSPSKEKLNIESVSIEYVVDPEYAFPLGWWSGELRVEKTSKEKEPNKAPVPTATSVTPAADAPVAPAAAAAQL